MDFKIQTTFNDLNCTVLKQPKSNKVMIIAPAIGVSRHFYRKFAEYYSNLGYTVITFDYSGMYFTGEKEKEHTHQLKDWGEKDIYSVIDYCSQAFKNMQIYFVGHSIAGQLLPLAANCNLISSSCLIASQNASIMNWRGLYKLNVSLFWYLIIPFFIRVNGKVPGYAYGGKYALYSRIASDWASWGKSTLGLLDIVENANQAYDDVNVPVKFFSIEKDHLLAPRSAVKKLFEQYGSSTKQLEHIDPKKYGIASMNHFDFFRSEYSFLWSKVEQWFQLTN